jgi:hypothetical protein
MKTTTLYLTLLASLVATAPALAAPPSDSPKAAPSLTGVGSPKLASIRVSSGEILPENVRATAALYLTATLEETRIFDVVDRIVDAFQSGQLPIGSKESRERLAAYAKARPDRVAKETRTELGRFAVDVVQSELDSQVTDTAKQMEAYGALLQAVAESAERFRQDNTTENEGRDSLGDRFPEEKWKSAVDLARSSNNHGYGAASFAAAKLEQQIRDMIAILSDPAVGDAYGARGQWAVVEKLGGKPAAESERIQKRADAGARLIGSLADNAALLETPKKRSELARRLASVAPQAKVWLAVKPARPSSPAPKRVRPLCLDEKRNFVPCTVTKR